MLPLPRLSLCRGFCVLTGLTGGILAIRLNTSIHCFAGCGTPTCTPNIRRFRLRPASSLIRVNNCPVMGMCTGLRLGQAHVFTVVCRIGTNVKDTGSFLIPRCPVGPHLFGVNIS